MLHVWIKTISFILKFLFSVVHFDLVSKVNRIYFLHLDQNSSATYYTLPHCLLLFKSSLTNEPGVDTITLLFIISKLLGDDGVRLCGSLIVSTVRGWEFTIASTSVKKVSRDSSCKYLAFPHSTQCRDAIAILHNKKKLHEISQEGKKKLKSQKIYFNESLCPVVKHILGKCNVLLKKNYADAF